MSLPCRPRCRPHLDVNPLTLPPWTHRPEDRGRRLRRLVWNLAGAGVTVGLPRAGTRAGSGMTHRAMAAIADGLEQRASPSCDTSFPIWKRAAGAPTPRPWRRQRCAEPPPKRSARRGSPAVRPGGRSFGGRMTSQAQTLDSVAGRVRLGCSSPFRSTLAGKAGGDSGGASRRRRRAHALPVRLNRCARRTRFA